MDDQLDRAITGVLNAETTARDIGQADTGVEGELSTMYDLTTAPRALRGAVRITCEHARDADFYQYKIKRGEDR